MERLTPLSDGELARLAQTLGARYSRSVVGFSRLGGELDLNYRVTGQGGERAFLRLSPPDLSASAVDWQNAVLIQLERSPLSVATPVLIRTSDNEIGVAFERDGGSTWLLRLTTWVDGRNVSELGETGRQFRRALGSLAAEVIDRLAPLGVGDTGQHEHHWMVERAGESLRETIDAATDPAQREALETAIAWFDDVSKHLSELPRAVVHQDLHDFNLLGERSQNGETVLTGVVDFNDAVYTVRIAELAVAAVYAALRQPNAFEAFSDVVEGYLACAELTELELNVLFPLGVARLAVNASTWTERSLGGNADYARARMVATWPALEQMLQVPREVAAERWRTAAREARSATPGGAS